MSYSILHVKFLKKIFIHRAKMGHQVLLDFQEIRQVNAMLFLFVMWKKFLEIKDTNQKYTKNSAHTVLSIKYNDKLTSQFHSHMVLFLNSCQ